MSIRSKLFAFVLFFLFFSFSLFLFVWENERARLHNISSKIEEDTSRNLQKVIELKSKSGKTLALDYSIWDEMVEFVSSKDEKWAKEIIEPSLATYSVDYIAVLDKNKNEIYKTSKNQIVENLLDSIDLKKTENQNGIFLHYFKVLNGTLVEIYCSSIHFSANIKREGESFGYFYVAKIWDDSYVKELGEVLSIKTILHLGHTITTNGSFFYEIKNDESTTIANIEGIASSEILATSTKMATRALFTFVIFELSIFAILIILVFKVFIHPLRIVSNSLKKGNVKDIEKLIANKDEFGEIALMIKNYMLQKSKLINEIDEKERTKHELFLLNQTLEARIEEEIEKNREKDHALMQRSRYAAMGEIIDSIAHHWRQPINSIGIYLQDLLEAYKYGELNEEYLKESIQKSMENINRISKIIDDFRFFFRPDREKKEVELISLIRDIVNLYDDKLSSKNIAILSTELEIKCHSFENDLKQVLANILLNAQEVSGKNSQIVVEVSKDDGFVDIEIRDSGGGIDEEIIDKVFEPHSGLGLYLAKVIVTNNLNGKIEVFNKDQGAVFKITFKCNG